MATESTLKPSLVDIRRRSLFAHLRRWRCAAVNLLFPPRCANCGGEMQNSGDEPLVCVSCMARLFPPTGAVCRRCAMPVKTSGHDNDDCPDCRTQRLHFDSVNTLGFYRGDLREAVLLMKRSQYEVLTMSVAAVLADRMSESLLHDPPDLVVPVPMHWSRRVLRGVNTAELLAEPVAVRCAVPLARDLLVCCRKTKKQGTLGPQERIANVRGAFRASASYVIKGANILLLDDVMTTGATVNEAARICRLAGARSVRVAVVARGVGIE